MPDNLEVAVASWMLSSPELGETANRLIAFADSQQGILQLLNPLQLAIAKVEALLTVVGRGSREEAS